MIFHNLETPSGIYMPKVRFTYALKRFFPDLKDVPVGGRSFHEIFTELDDHYPGISSYILDEQGNLRKHVNIFIDGKMISDRKTLSDSFTGNSEIYIMQALSGG
jgi:hypothetical protein